MLNHIEQHDPRPCCCLLQVVHRHHHAKDALRDLLCQDHCQQRCRSRLPSLCIDPVLRYVLADLRRLFDDGAKLFANLDDWYLRVKPQCLPDALVLVSASTRSINLQLQSSKIQQRASCPDPVHPELLEKVKPTLNCLGGHLHIQESAIPW